MLSRLGCRSGPLRQIVTRPDVSKRVVLSLARCSSSGQETTMAEHLENWQKAHQLYYGPERDTKNFPMLRQPLDSPPTRIGILPESWFTAFANKTGVTGPYMLGIGTITFLMSKELWIVEHGFTEFVAFWLAAILLTKKLGASTAATLDSDMEKYETKYWKEPLAKTKASAESYITGMRDVISQQGAQKHIFESKRENVDLQLEAQYRDRLVEVHSAVKKRIDYQTATETAKRRFEQEHMVNWIIDSVVKGISPQQEKESLGQCFRDLKELSTRKAAAV